MNELKRESFGTVHTNIFIQRIFVQLQEKRYITNKINEIKKEAILYKKVIGIISSAYHFI